jgi:WS/DGAT/MGAT family acyltransferase
MVSPKRISMLDTIFLAGESRESMMHVGGLLVFTPPADAPPDLLRRLMGEFKQGTHVFSPWNLKLRAPEFLTSPRQAWIEDEDFDLDYHVRRSALPSPGDERELGILVSRLHSVQMDFHRPLWELHIIEGLSGGRFALYFKVHHSLVDGYSAMRLLAQSFSMDADDRKMPLFFAMPPRERRESAHEPPVPTLAALQALAREQAGITRNVSRALMTLVRAVRAKDPTLVGPTSAPKTIFNRRVSRNRRFATQQFDLGRLKAVAKAHDCTLNDVCLALCGTALRRLLLEQNALPEKSLTAMMPVNIRPKDDPGGGNAVGAILASLATDIGDAHARLRSIILSTRAAKGQLTGMPKNAILQYTALLMAPLSLQQVTRTAGRVRPAFNVVISNVPGPERTLYFRGARLDAAYPLSIPFHGYGLNITLNSYVDTLNFGFIGCRDALPHLQRLAVYSGEALDELERAG